MSSDSTDGTPEPIKNRFKFIVCQEEVYLKEPVRYIHLNWWEDV